MENTTMDRNIVNEEINAYVFIQTYSGFLDSVILDTQKIREVMSTAVISGNYDVLVKVNVHCLEDLFNVSERIKMIKGIQQATTHIIEKEFLT